MLMLMLVLMLHFLIWYWTGAGTDADMLCCNSCNGAHGFVQILLLPLQFVQLNWHLQPINRPLLPFLA
jgi:hypothetical protein